MEHKQEPLVKEPRTMQLVQIEMQQVCAEVGFLQYQIEVAMPRELQKHFNNLTSLQKELDKFMKEADAQQRAVETMKAASNGKKVDLKPVIDIEAPQVNTEITQ